jgi:hypothetical protein
MRGRRDKKNRGVTVKFSTKFPAWIIVTGPHEITACASNESSCGLCLGNGPVGGCKCVRAELLHYQRHGIRLSLATCPAIRFFRTSRLSREWWLLWSGRITSRMAAAGASAPSRSTAPCPAAAILFGSTCTGHRRSGKCPGRAAQKWRGGLRLAGWRGGLSAYLRALS